MVTNMLLVDLFLVLYKPITSLYQDFYLRKKGCHTINDIGKNTKLGHNSISLLLFTELQGRVRKFFQSILQNDISRNIFCVRILHKNNRIITCTSDFKRNSKLVVKRSNNFQCCIICTKWMAQDRFKPFFSHKNELLVDKLLLLWGCCKIIPFQLIDKALNDLHDNHLGLYV